MLVVLLVGVVVDVGYARRDETKRGSVHNGTWFVASLGVMAAVSSLGSPTFGGVGAIPFGWDLLLVALLALGFYAWGLSQGVALRRTVRVAPGRARSPGVRIDRQLLAVTSLPSRMTTEPRPIDARAFALACGLLWSGLVVLLGLGARLGWGRRWQRLLADVYRGYDASLPGLVVGAAWALADGLIGGYGFARLYNLLTRSPAPPSAAVEATTAEPTPTAD